MPFTVYFTNAAERRVQQHFDLLRGKGSDELAARLSQAIVDGNRRDRLAGVDRNGVPLVPLLSKRRGRYKGATGPPLAPFRERSRVITKFECRISRKWGFGNFQLSAGWRDVLSDPPKGGSVFARFVRRVSRGKGGIPFLPFHFEGSGRLPKRDLAGISPKTEAELAEIVRSHVRGRLSL